MVGCRDDRLFILRSLTKSFAVPGLRFGYGFGEPGLIERMEVARPPWSVNAYAEQFAIAAFRAYDQLEVSREYIRRECAWLTRKFSALGLRPHPAAANFILVDLPVAADDLSRVLAGKGILVRDCTSFGLPASIRVAVRRHEENAWLIEEISECLP
jgi:threonine-phosphate decarboxylase